MAIWITGIIFWIACGALHYAMWLAYFQSDTFASIRDEGYWGDVIIGAGLGIGGPLSLFTSIIIFGKKDGLKWK